MKWPSVDIQEASNLIVRVCTIGYKKKGESIVVLLINKIDNSVLYSIVIDSFKRNSVNKTIDLLRNHNISCLDILCWSHPDFDHSCGIDDILSQFCRDATRVVTPISFWSDDYSIKAFKPNQREKNFVNKLREINKKTKCSLHPKSVSQGGCELIGCLKLESIDGVIPVKIQIISPFIESLKGQIDEFLDNPKNKQPTRNQTSVSILLEIGPYKMVFAADLPNDEIEMIDEDLVANPIFLKIPHHGSDSSIKMTEYIPPFSNMMACCTVYKSTKAGSNLPHKHVIDRYCISCDVVMSTGSDEVNEYGIVTADFDFFGNYQCSIYTEGSAVFLKGLHDFDDQLPK